MKFDATDTDRRMNLRLTAANDDALRVLARLHDTSKTELVNAAIYKYVTDHSAEISAANKLFNQF